MGVRNVVFEVIATTKDFPVGTVDTGFTFEILNTEGVVLSKITTNALGATFPNVPDGASYIAKVTANGVSAQKTFSIPASAVTLQVPSDIKVTF